MTHRTPSSSSNTLSPSSCATSAIPNTASQSDTPTNHPLPNPTTSSLSYLKDLNDAQRDAVITTQGPVLVLAGAGTGKTRVLTTRLAYILHQGLATPHQILSVTFTNKAATEIAKRCRHMTGLSVWNMPFLGTFHSVCTQILRRHAERVDLKHHFIILDPDDVIRLCKQILEYYEIDQKKWPARLLAYYIDTWKNKGFTPHNIPDAEASLFAEEHGKTIYKTYQQRLKTLNACDFGDLILECFRLFQENPDVLQQYQETIRYVMVDEYQDTNTIQYMWLRLLVQHTQHGETPNICCVGDDDQSIYSWRGAQVQNILSFPDYFPHSTIIRLQSNYRSTGHILNAASHLISHNKDRHNKTLKTNGKEGDKIIISGFSDSQSEAQFVCETIFNTIRQHNTSPEEIAILVRSTAQIREFEEQLNLLTIDYRIIGGPRFYERAEIRDALAYLRLLIHHSFDPALERIINKPTRGIGKKSLQTMQFYARQQDISLYDSAIKLVETNELSAKARASLIQLLRQFSTWNEAQSTIPHNELLEMILEESGYTDMLCKDKDPKAESKLDNLKELSRAMREFDSLEEFLEHVSLIMDSDTATTHEKVTLMTLHSAKGLEYDHVFLPGWEQGLFPHQRSLNDGGLEEERRLAYVGITRARKHVYISYATNRFLHNQWQTSLPSWFIDELPRESLVQQNWQEERTHRRHVNRTNDDIDSSYAQESSQWRFNTPVPSYKNTHPFDIGNRIFHQKYGYGCITNIDQDRLHVTFEKAGDKIVFADFVRID